MNMSQQDLVELFPCFDRATDDLMREIAHIGNKVNIQEGKCIFEQQAKMEFVAFLLEGKVRVYINSASGREITLYYVNPGEMCPTNIIYALMDNNSPARAVAAEPGVAIVVPANAFRSWMDDHSCVRWGAIAAISDRLIDMMSLIDQITFQRLDRRLAEFLKTEFGAPCETPARINLTQEKIAYELGSSREVISRLLCDFENVGMVHRGRGALTLLDSGLLDQYSCHG